MRSAHRRGLVAALTLLGATAVAAPAATAQVPPLPVPTLPPVTAPPVTTPPVTVPPVTIPPATLPGTDADPASPTLPAAPSDGIPDQLRWGDFAPAAPGTLTIHQPDGTAFHGVLTNAEVGGDVEVDGYTVTRGDDGWWRYATGRDDGGALVPSEARAGLDGPPAGVPVAVGRHRSIWEGPGGVDTRTELLRQLQVGFRQAAEQARAAGEPIVFKFPVLMLATWWDADQGQTEPQFQDGDTADYYRQLLNGFGGNPRGTLTEFYFENSYGQFLVQVDVYGPFTSQRSRLDRCYYGGVEPGDDNQVDLDLFDDVLGVGGAGAIGMGLEAVPQADPTVDFSQYDNDGDGFVDFTAILHSGPDMAATGDPCHTWSHAIQAGLAGPLVEGLLGLPPGTLHHGIPTTDGVFVDRLFTMPEIDLEIGVATHEMAHALGEPDYYNPDYTSMGTGDWDLMAGGSWFGNPPGSNPTHFNPASRVFQGWVTPTIVHDDTRNVVIEPRELTPDGYTADQPNPNLVLVPTQWVHIGQTDAEGHTWTESDTYGLPLDGDRGYVVEGYYLENVSRVVHAPPIHADMDDGPYFDRQALGSGLLVWHFDYVRRSNTYNGGNDAGSDPNRPQMDPMEFDRNDDTQELQLGLTRGEPGDLVFDAATGITSGTRLPHGAADAPPGDPQADQTWSGTVVPLGTDTHELTVDDNPANAQLTVTVTGLGDCTLSLFGPDGTQVGGTQDAGSVGDAETITVHHPVPGTWRVEVGDFAGCLQYDGEASFAAAGDVFDTTGSADTWSNWTEQPTGWAFTNIRPEGGQRAGSTELSGANEAPGPEGIRLDILHIGADEVDASPGFVQADGPANAGVSTAYSVPVFNNGGTPADVPVRVRVGGTNGPVVAEGTVSLPAYGRTAFHFERTPPAEGIERFAVQIDPDGTVPEASETNNVQRTDVEVGPANPTVLVVDDDGAADSEDLYAGALRALGVPYSVVEGHADAELLGRYEAVIWEAGLERDQGQLDPDDREAIADYLQGGGKLLYTSPRAAGGLGEGPTSTTPNQTADMPVFLAEWFGAAYQDTLQVGGGTVTGRDLLGDATYQTDVFPGRPLQDVFSATSDGAGGDVTPVAGWDRAGEDGIVGVRVDGDAEHGGFQTVFLGFNLSQLTSADQAVDILDKVLDHFGVDGSAMPAPRPPLVFHTQVRNRGEGVDTPVTAVVLGARLRSVELRYRTHGSDEFTSVPMTPGTRPGTYTAVIPGGDVTPAGVEYGIVATAGATTWDPVRAGSAGVYHAIAVQRL